MPYWASARSDWEGDTRHGWFYKGLGKVGAVSRRWWGYKNGRHAPSAKVVALAQAKCPAAAVAFQSPLWDALRLDRSATHVAKALAGRTTKFGEREPIADLDVSLRRGMATSAHRAGADFRDIKKQGGWRHDGTVQGYIEEASRFEENAAGSLLRTRIKSA